MTKHNLKISIELFATIILLLVINACSTPIKPDNQDRFDGDRAFQDIVYQVSLGPRIPGTGAHREEGDWIIRELLSNGWKVEAQEVIRQGQPIRNIIGRFGEGSPWIIIGGHYDTRIFADQDDSYRNKQKPVPGANDGASGVAVLLELARIIPQQAIINRITKANQIWLVFFDAEDNGKINGWDWSMGSETFVDNLGKYPDQVIIIDMIGDKDLNIYREGNSDPILTEEIWISADQLGYSEYFINQTKYFMVDDHIPFINHGISAANVIDFDYPYWHTTADTIDKVSSNSLQIVGDTIMGWLTR